MSVKLRLTRIGRHKDPFYRIVAADSRFARDGRYIEQIGTYDPVNGVESADINEELAMKWLGFRSRHAQPQRHHDQVCRKQSQERRQIRNG